ncbi:MAG TPA: hypothetical protein VL576_02580 [Candidatus Paceibacterota bacterium]|jgi:hypothetical protein|nr:hypothetical protein [Candidatus Paceibacterota bacterium]
MKTFKLLLAGAALMLFASCAPSYFDKNHDPKPQPKPDPKAPSVTITNPKGGETYHPGDSILNFSVTTKNLIDTILPNDSKTNYAVVQLVHIVGKDTTSIAYLGPYAGKDDGYGPFNGANAYFMKFFKLPENIGLPAAAAFNGVFDNNYALKVYAVKGATIVKAVTVSKKFSITQ